MSSPAQTRDQARTRALNKIYERLLLEGRDNWTEEDYNLAVDHFEKLWPIEQETEGEK